MRDLAGLSAWIQRISGVTVRYNRVGGVCMKNGWKELVLAIVLAWGIPWVVMAAAEVILEKETAAQQPAAETEQTQPPVGQTIALWNGESLQEVLLNDYLTKVQSEHTALYLH